MKEIKRERGYSNEQIARLSGVPLSTVRKIFSGATTAPRYDTLQALSKVFEEPSLYIKEPFAPYTAKQQGEFTLDDYYAVPEEQRVELIDGVIYDMGAPTTIHQLLIGILHSLLRSYIKRNHGKCTAFLSPADVRLDCDNKTMVQPDVFVICDRSKITRTCCEGAPDLIIEVLSPSTKKKDSFLKAQKYLDAGVREYWLVDPMRKRVVVYLFDGSPDFAQNLYTFEHSVPVAIFDGKCVINFAEVYEEIAFLYEDDSDTQSQ